MPTRYRWHHSDGGPEGAPLEEKPFAFVSKSKRACCSECAPPTRDAVDVPRWAVRPFVAKGYRANLSLAQCLLSFFYLHNESGNIWSHTFGAGLALRLIGSVSEHFVTAAAAAAAAAATTTTNGGDHASSPAIRGERAVMWAYLGVAALAFTFSTVYHLGNCGNERTCSMLLRLDVTGIACLIAASFVPGVFYGFACFPHLQQVYLGLVVLILLAGLAASSLGSDASSERASRLRTQVFVGAVLIGLLIAIHWICLVHNEARRILVGKLLGMLGLYLLGFIFYASHFPECAFPGSFDLVLSSHQLWHWCCVAAFYVWWLNCLECHALLVDRGCVAFVAPSPTGGGGSGLRGAGR